MRITIIKEANGIRLLEGNLPENREVRVFTEDEVMLFQGWKQWMALSEEQREDMLMQTQSAEYKEWMEEEV